MINLFVPTGKILAIILVLLSFACNRKPSNSEMLESKVSNNEEFLKIANQFVLAFNSKDYAEIDKFVDKELGFFVLNNPGAATMPFYFNSWKQIIEMEGYFDVAQLKVLKFDIQYCQQGLKPVFNCELNKWTAEGCFYGKNIDLKLVNLHNSLLEFDFLNKVQYNKTISSAQKIDSFDKYFVYNTNTNLGFYFAKFNDKWVLVCVDYIIPCSA